MTYNLPNLKARTLQRSSEQWAHLVDLVWREVAHEGLEDARCQQLPHNKPNYGPLKVALIQTPLSKNFSQV